MDLVEFMALKMADGADKCIGPIYIYIGIGLIGQWIGRLMPIRIITAQ